VRRQVTLLDSLIEVKLIQAKGLPVMDLDGTSDPYCKLRYGANHQEHQSSTKHNELDPTWDEIFMFKYDGIGKLEVELWDYDYFGNEQIGKVALKVDNLKDGECRQEWHTVLPPSGRRLAAAADSLGDIELSIRRIDGSPWKDQVLDVVVHQARGLHARDWNIFASSSSDPYVELRHGQRQLAQTSVKYECLAPVWEWERVFWLRAQHNLIVTVMDKDHITFDKPLGVVELNVRDLKAGIVQRGWHTLQEPGQGPKTGGDDEEKKYGEVELSLSVRDGSHYKDTMLEVTVVQAKDIAALDNGGASDPFVELTHGAQTSTTATEFKTLTPNWNTMFAFDYKPLCDVVVEIFDHDVFFIFTTKSFIGQAKVPVHQLTFGEPVKAWYPMQDAAGKDAGQVELVCKWVDNSQYKDSKLLVKVLRARNLMAMDMDGTSDPYIVLKYGKQEHRGNKSHQTLNPEWNTHMKFEFLPHESLLITVFDADDSSYNSDDFMGKVQLPVRSELMKGMAKRQWLPLTDEFGNVDPTLGEIEVEIEWADSLRLKVGGAKEAGAK